MLTGPQLMTIAEYAEHRGVSASYIRRMRRRGSLVLGDGDLVDVGASDDLLDGLTHPIHGGPRPGSGRPSGRRGEGRAGVAASGSSTDRAPVPPGGAVEPGAEPATLAPGAAASVTGERMGSPQVRDRRQPAAGESAADASPPPLPASISVQEAVRRERLARARLAELELGEQAGKLMRVDIANRAVFTLVRQALNQLQGMSGRLAKTLAAETDPFRVGALLDAEVANVCAEMRAAAETLLDAGSAAARAESVDADTDGEPDDPDSEAAGA